MQGAKPFAWYHVLSSGLAAHALVGVMRSIQSLKPKRQRRVIDLVAKAGVDVSDWANFAGGAARAATNPRYCYEWSFVEPSRVVVLNLWHARMRIRRGKIFQ